MTTYYVATNGDDANSGTSIGSPRATPPGSLSAGDIVYFRAGTHALQIKPTNSGSSGNVITYKAYNSESVTITGVNGTYSIVEVLGKDYITFEDLTFRYIDSTPANKRFPWVFISGGSENVIFRDCTFRKTANTNMVAAYKSGYREWAIAIDNSDAVEIDGCLIRDVNQGIQVRTNATNTHIHDCTITNVAQSCIVVTNSGGAERGCLIEDNILEDSQVEDGIQFMQDFDAADTTSDLSNRGTIVRNNIIRNCAENAVDFKGARYITVEGNIIYGTIGSNDGSVSGWNHRSMGVMMRGSRATCADIIIRNNVLYDNCPGIWFDGPRSKLYNNVFLYNNRDYGGTNNYNSSYAWRNRYTESADLGIRNNIAGGHSKAQIAPRVSGSNSFDIDYNLYFGLNKFSIDGTSFTLKSFDQWQDYADSSAKITVGEEQNSEYVSSLSDVKFVDVSVSLLQADPPTTHGNFDFKLRPTSPGYQAGGHLTRANGSGSSSTSLIVDDATWFMDGYGSSLTSGDTITVNATTVTITTINYGTNTLTITPAASWSDNDPVYWGSNETPHIGIVDVLSSTVVSDFTISPTTGTAPLTVNITDNSFGATNYSYAVSSEGGEFVQFSTSSDPSYVFQVAGDYQIRQTVDDGAGTSDSSIVPITVNIETTTGGGDTGGDTGGTNNNAPPCAGTVVTNGTFPTATTGWTYNGDAFVITDAEAVISHDGDGIEVFKQTLTLENAATYAVSFEMRTPDENPVQFLLDGLDEYVALTSTMATYSYQFTATGTSKEIQWLIESAGTYYLDNICVRKISGAQAYSDSAATTPTNLLANGDFSNATWDTDWDFSGSSGLISVTGGELYWDNSAGGSYFLSQPVSWAASTRYTWIYEIRHDAGGSRNMFVSIRDSGDSVYGLNETDATPKGGSMTTHTHTFTPDGTDASGYIRMFTANVATFVFDNVRVYEGSAFAAFTASWDQDSVGATVTFADESIYYEGTLTYSWEVQIDGGGYSEFSTAQNPTYSVTAAGTYDFRVTIDNGSDTDTVGITGVVFDPATKDYYQRGVRLGVRKGMN